MDNGTGICYEVDNTIDPQKVVDICLQYRIKKIRLYEPNATLLGKLGPTRIEVALGVPNADISSLSASPENAVAWFQNNVARYTGVNFRYIVVGNNWFNPYTYAAGVAQAMKNMYTAVVSAGYKEKIIVTTSIESTIDSGSGTGTLSVYDVPSKSTFSPAFEIYIRDVVPLLVMWKGQLLVTVKPYEFYIAQKSPPPSNQIIDYAVFRSERTVVDDGPRKYKNLFDAIVDSVYWALEKVGGQSLEIVVAGSGWPTAGGAAADLQNASIYNNNLLRHVREGGTPKFPGNPIPTYIFEMFDSRKFAYPGQEYVNNYGVFLPDGTPKYEINPFSG